MTTEQLYNIYTRFPSVQTDTRKIKSGDIFFALKGPNFNGNAFALKALEEGAEYAVVDEPIDYSNEKLLLVEDVLTALQSLAKYHRQQFHIPFIAITGSNGKTTTKELTSAVLATHYKTYTTQGNLNNHIGVPLTLLSIAHDAQMAVIEMGANHQQEIAGYCSYTLPTYGIITNCGKAHLEGFGGTEGVRKGKGELFDFLKSNNGNAFIDTDQEYLIGMSNGIKEIFKYGTHDGDVIGISHSNSDFLSVHITKGVNFSSVQTHLVGDYNLPNVLCAIAVGKYFNVPDERIKKAIEDYIPSNSRSQMIQLGSNSIILDAYNANPSSTKVAIENFAKLNADKKMLMLGGMMELGKESIHEHQSIVNLIETYPWHQVVLVGGDYKHTQHSFTYLENALQAKDWLQQQHVEHAHILIKGSRSIAMEKVIAP